MSTVTYSCMEEGHAVLLSFYVDCNLQLHGRGPRCFAVDMSTVTYSCMKEDHAFCCRLMSTLTYSCMEEAHARLLLSSYVDSNPQLHGRGPRFFVVVLYGPPLPQLAYASSTCYTDRRKTKTEVRKVL